MENIVYGSAQDVIIKQSVKRRNRRMRKKDIENLAFVMASPIRRAIIRALAENDHLPNEEEESVKNAS
jgi:hypothetical protein